SSSGPRSSPRCAASSAPTRPRTCGSGWVRFPPLRARREVPDEPRVPRPLEPCRRSASRRARPRRAALRLLRRRGADGSSHRARPRLRPPPDAAPRALRVRALLRVQGAPPPRPVAGFAAVPRTCRPPAARLSCATAPGPRSPSSLPWRRRDSLWSDPAMVKIRLARAGAKKRPFYRVVAIDERKRRDGRPLEFLGTYDPIAKPKAIQIDTEKVDAWVRKGAQVSDTVAALLREVRRRSASAAPAAN